MPLNPTGAVLHLRASNFVGGPERQILRYCTAPDTATPAPRQILATFIRAGEPGGEGHKLLHAARAAGVEAWALEGGGRRELQALAALDRLIGEQGVGLLCTHGYRADLMGLLAARRRRIPVAWFLRGWTGEDARVRTYEAVDRALLGRADRIVCLSQTQAGALPARVSPDRVRIVVNAIEHRQVTGPDRAAARRELHERFPLGDSASSPVVAIAGRLSPEKGAAVFLRSAARVREQRPDGRFLVFGDGPMRAQLEALSQQLGLLGCLHFAGHDPDWTRLLPGLDLLVNPSHSEQAPNVVLEAMAAGVAVLATAVGAVPEIGGAHEGGPLALSLVEPGAVAPMTEGMLALLADDAARAQLAVRGRTRVREAYSPERQQAQLGRVYRELLDVPAIAERPARASQAVPARPARASQAVPARPARASQAVPAPQAGGAANSGAPARVRAAEGPAPRPSMLPSVSVVLPVRHEARGLPTLLDQLLRQDYPADRGEIIVADGGAGAPDDGTAAIAQDFASRYPGRIRWVPNPRRWSSAGRNCGLAAATGEWIVFVDGHCRLPGSDWLRLSIAEAVAQDALCLSRPQPLTAEMSGFWQSVIAHARECRIGHGADSTIYAEQARGWVRPDSSGAVYHRSLFQRVGQYDESFDACEDVEFNHRLTRVGVRAWLTPVAAVHYAARSSLRGLWLQMVRYGRGRVRLARKHRDAFTWAQCLPALWLAWLPVGIVAAAFGHGMLRWANAAGLALYALALAVSSLGVARRHGVGEGLAAPAAFLTIHAGLGAGFWREVLTSGRRRTSSPTLTAVGGPVPVSEFVSRSES